MSDGRDTINLPERRPRNPKVAQAMGRIEAQAKPVAVTAPEPAKKPRKKEPVTVSLPTELRGRARAAFQHERFHEGTSSFSEFVEAAIENHVRRVELKYNAGAEFPPDEGKLTAGRPAGS